MPFEVITIMGPSVEESLTGNSRDNKAVAEKIEEAYSSVAERHGRIVGQHVMHLFNSGFEHRETEVKESVLFLVADIPDSDVELT